MLRARLTAAWRESPSCALLECRSAIASAPAAAGTQTTTATGPTVRTPASETATVRAAGPCRLAATSTAQVLRESPPRSADPGAVRPRRRSGHLLRQPVSGPSRRRTALLRLGGNIADDSLVADPGHEDAAEPLLAHRGGGRSSRRCSTALGGKAILASTSRRGRARRNIAPAEVADFNRAVGASLIDRPNWGTSRSSSSRYPCVNGVRGERGPYPSPLTARPPASPQAGGAPPHGPGSVGREWLNKLGTVLSVVPRALKLVTVHAYATKPRPGDSRTSRCRTSSRCLHPGRPTRPWNR